MTVNFYSADIPELAICRKYSDLTNDYQEWYVHVNHALANGFYKEINFGDIRIGYGSMNLTQKTLLHFESDSETVEMHFALNNHRAIHSKDLPRSTPFSPNQHNIAYNNSVKGQMEWQGSGWNIFEVNLRPTFFKRYLPESSPLLAIFKKHIESGSTTFLNEQNGFISHQMYHIIHDIMNCERNGHFKKMFVEAKVIELLLLQLEQLGELNFLNASLKKSDIDKMYAVRDFILNNLTEPHSLIDLAHKAGTNEFTLKKGFKELFGTTVFGFWNDVKMEGARNMLETKSMNVREVAGAIGYKNPQHFTAAFKRKFGVPPSRLKGNA